MKYSEYIAEKIDTISYSEYIAKDPIDSRIRKIKSILEKIKNLSYIC